MDPTITATVIGVLLSVCFGAFATAFAWLRGDLNKMDARFDKMDDKVDARFDKVDARFEQLEAKVDDIITALTRGERPAGPDGSGADD